MKSKRQSKILEIIGSVDIENQKQLTDELNKHGFHCAQATVSRDINDLKLVKELLPSGRFHYTVSSQNETGAFLARLNTIFRECVTSYDSAQNIVVIKTLPGLASAACSALDTMNIPFMVGSLAGDDTALLVMRDTASAISFCTELKKLVSY